MDNFDKLHAEQDAFIRNVFHEDKIISQPVIENFSNYIENSNIKAQKYTYKQKHLITFLIIVLMISVGYNIFLTFYHKTDSSNNNQAVISNEIKDNLRNNIKNEINNEENTNTTVIEENTTNNIKIANVTEAPKQKINYDKLDLNALKDLMNTYSLGIQRLSYDEENLESNTILLFIAKEYFDTNSSKSGLHVDTKYAQTVKNIHTYLTELTGNDYNNIDYIHSFNNYIGYAPSNKAYVFGKDSNSITREKYECSDITITNETDGLYTAKATVTRTIDKEDTVYEITFTFKLNENYVYQPFNIKSLKAKNTSFYPDNTVHLVSQESLAETEEDEN